MPGNNNWLNEDYTYCTCGGLYVPGNCILTCQVRVTVHGSGLCCCVPCLLNTNQLTLLNTVNLFFSAAELGMKFRNQGKKTAQFPRGKGRHLSKKNNVTCMAFTVLSEIGSNICTARPTRSACIVSLYLLLSFVCVYRNKFCEDT